MSFSLLLFGLFGIVNVAEGYMCKCGWNFFYGSGHCYLFSKNTLTWSEAEAYCRRSGGYLTKVNDGHENNWLKYSAMKLDQLLKAKKHYWIGATDLHQEGHWKWNIDFSPVSFKGWGRGEPNNDGKSEHCAHIYSSRHYTWNDYPCTGRVNYVCERPAFGKPACKCDA